jgi:hypothetical protein
MCDWQWESFENLMNKGSFVITDAGPLYTPIRSFSIGRNDKLELILETHAEQTATSNAVVHPAGTVQQNTDSVTFSTGVGIKVVAHGVQSRNHSISFHGNPALGELKEKSSVHRLEGILRSDKEPRYVVDWLVNVDDVYQWPDITDEMTEITKTRRLSGGSDSPTLRSSRKSNSLTRNCVRLCVGGYEMYFCTCKGLDAGKNSEGGFILYVGNPSDDFRDQIRTCFSFALGEYLVYLGSSSFCENWGLLSFRAMSAYSLGGAAFKLPPMPPAPLGMHYDWELNPALLSRLVGSIFSQHSTLKFGSLSWAYWHAVCATPHIAAVHFGAAIEALQRSYLEGHENLIKTTLIEKDAWKQLKASAEAAVGGLETDNDTKQLLRNKLAGLNEPPHSVMTDRLVQVLDIELGESEKKAWKRRNDAGHGKDISPDQYVELIRDIKLLRVRFHRLILSMTNASDFYYDYFSLGRPTRKLRDPIP